MQTTNVASKEIPKPGTIICMQAFSCDTQRQLGLTVSCEFFDKHASERAKQIFNDPERLPYWDVFIPALVLEEDMSWSLRFRQRHHSITLVSILEESEELRACLKIINCFTHRDGSRYYSRFYEGIYMFMGFINGNEEVKNYVFFKQNLLVKEFMDSLIEERKLIK